MTSRATQELCRKPKPVLQDDTIFEGYGHGKIWRRNLGSTILDFTIFLTSQEIMFGKTCMKFYGCHSVIKFDGHTVDIPKLLQRIKEQLLKILVP